MAPAKQNAPNLINNGLRIFKASFSLSGGAAVYPRRHLTQHSMTASGRFVNHLHVARGKDTAAAKKCLGKLTPDRAAADSVFARAYPAYSSAACKRFRPLALCSMR